MTLEELMEHSDKRDDRIEIKIDKLDEFIHNGLSERIIRGITDYLNKQTARRVRLFFRILFTALIIASVSCGIGYAISLL